MTMTSLSKEFMKARRMKASELRLNNYVLEDGQVVLLSTNYDLFKCLVNVDRGIGFEPILLTEEWLLKFGFIYHESIKHWVKNWGINGAEFIKFDEYYNLFSFQLGKDNYKVIDIGVHQLQNLWFVLTGEEII